MNQFVMLGCLWLGACATAFSQQTSGVNYQLEPMPSVHKPLPENSVPMGDSQTFEEVKLNLPITARPYEPTWASIESNYPGTPEWLRESKFGIWIHFGPQSAGESGDWYARKMYVEGTPAYENHLKNYGHPSVVGYKEVLRDWNPKKFNPKALVDIYKDAGARFLIIQGVHHDQFDLWDSKYQAWIAETPVGDWFYGPNFVYSSDAMIRYLLEIVARDGSVGVSIPLRPDGSLDEGCVKMLKEVGQWMRVNGQGIYGSSAWRVLGEGKDGKLNVLPGGFIGGSQANHIFYSTDFRFTVGKDKALYAWCMTVPNPGETLKIVSLGTNSTVEKKKVTSVELLGVEGNKLEWKQEADGLRIVYPKSASLKTAVGFRIVCE